MSDLLKHLKDAADNHKNKVERLKNQVEEDKVSLQKLDKKHNELVLKGKDDEADQVFNQLFDLKRDIEKNERKVKILGSGQVSEEVRQAAEKLKSHAENERLKADKLLTKKNDEIKEIRRQYFEKLSEIGEAIRSKHEIVKLDAVAYNHLNPNDKISVMGDVNFREYREHEYLIKDDRVVLHVLSGLKKGE
jgi:uncharacterized protein YoxC